MKDKISVELGVCRRIPVQTIRRISHRNKDVYYEFKILSKFLELEEDYKEFESICEEYVVELDSAH